MSNTVVQNTEVASAEDALELAKIANEKLMTDLLGAGRYTPAGREFAKGLVRYEICADLEHACYCAMVLMAEAGELFKSAQAKLKFGGGTIGSVTLGELVSAIKTTETPVLSLGIAISGADKHNKRNPHIRVKFLTVEGENNPIRDFLDEHTKEACLERAAKAKAKAAQRAADAVANGPRR